MPKISLDRALFLAVEVEVPLACPKCKADLTAPGSVEEWDWTDYRLGMHFTPEGMGDCASDSGSGSGTNSYHPISVACRECGHTLADAGEPTKDELLAHIQAPALLALIEQGIGLMPLGSAKRADWMRGAMAALGGKVRLPHDGSEQCSCSRCCRIDPSRGATMPPSDRQAGDS